MSEEGSPNPLYKKLKTAIEREEHLLCADAKQWRRDRNDPESEILSAVLQDVIVDGYKKLVIAATDAFQNRNALGPEGFREAQMTVCRKIIDTMLDTPDLQAVQRDDKDKEKVALQLLGSIIYRAKKAIGGIITVDRLYIGSASERIAYAAHNSSGPSI